MNQLLNDITLAIERKNFKEFSSIIDHFTAKDLLEVVSFFSSGKPSKETYRKLDTLAWFVFIERQGQSFGEPTHFPLSDGIIKFQELLYSLKVFVVVRVPFDRWSDLLYEVFKFCEKLNTSGPTDANVFGLVEKRKEFLLNDEKYRDRFIDYLNGAL